MEMLKIVGEVALVGILVILLIRQVKQKEKGQANDSKVLEEKEASDHVAVQGMVIGMCLGSGAGLVFGHMLIGIVAGMFLGTMVDLLGKK